MEAAVNEDRAREVVELDETTSGYQYRMLCLQMANSAQEIEGDMDLEKVRERFKCYWECVLGVDFVEMTDIIRETIREVKGTA
jgi:hypothetical protein